MPNAAQKKIADAGSSQKFTEIKEIIDEIVILQGSNACLIIEVQASNFALLSREEQDSKIFAYASLLNSLSFPIQIVIRNKKLDISSYLRLLDQEAQKTSLPHEGVTEEEGQKMVNYIRLYRDFVQELVKVNIVLDKKFYLVIPYSYLEQGARSATGLGQKSDFLTSAKTALHGKANSLLDQLGRLNLRSKILQNEELIKVLYSIFNEDIEEVTGLEESVKTPMVKGQKTR